MASRKCDESECVASMPTVTDRTCHKMYIYIDSHDSTCERSTGPHCRNTLNNVRIDNVLCGGQTKISKYKKKAVSKLTIIGLSLKMGIEFLIRHKERSTLRTSHQSFMRMRSYMILHQFCLSKQFTTSYPTTTNFFRLQFHSSLERIVSAHMLKERQYAIETIGTVKPFTRVLFGTNVIGKNVTTTRIQSTIWHFLSQQQTFANRF